MSLKCSVSSGAAWTHCCPHQQRWKAEQSHFFRCLRALWKMNKHIQPLILGLHKWSFQGKNIFLVEKTCAIKEGLSEESAILVGSGTVGKQHSWWQHSPAAPSAGTNSSCSSCSQPGLCGNDGNITGALGHWDICNSSQKGAQQSASEPGPLTHGMLLRTLCPTKSQAKSWELHRNWSILADHFTHWRSNYNKQLHLDTVLAGNLKCCKSIGENIPMATKHCPLSLS